MFVRKLILLALMGLLLVGVIPLLLGLLEEEGWPNARQTEETINEAKPNEPLLEVTEAPVPPLEPLDAETIEKMPWAEYIRFFPDTEEGEVGFSLYDDAEANFLSTFEELGFHQIGHPISRRFRRDGLVMQAFQKGIMQSMPDTSAVGLLNIFDELSHAGLDPALYDIYQVPYHLPPEWDGDLASDELVTKRLTLLNEHPSLRDAYFAASDPLAIYGLPASRVEDMGNHFALRLQRTMLQQWKEDVPWAKAGQVTIANSGEIAKKVGGLPAGALLPEHKSGQLVLVIPWSEIALPLPADPTTTWHLPIYPNIVQMRDTMLKIFQANELEFDIGYPVQGFSPDPIYRRLFVRDTSTLMTGASYFYPAERLKWGVEGFLHRQYDHHTVSTEDGWQAGFGAIPATVGFDTIIDKASTVSDEESHLIHAAYVTYETIDDPYWLHQKMTSRTNWADQEVNLPIITRLNAVGNWLLKKRHDPVTGLIVRDHTTDWGDVRFQPSRGNPTDIDPRNVVWTASIYDQALTYRAWRELAILNRAAGDEERAQQWESAADALRNASNKHLWQPERGFYRTHLHITPLEHDFDEDAIVSITNAVAIVCGLTDASQNKQIMRALEKARLDAGAPKPGVVLYPSYPTAFYSLPQMRLASTYQNGGVWDWWGAWQVLAAFEKGYGNWGRRYLLQTAADWATHPEQIFEWQSVRSLEGAGGDQYTGAAGIYAQVIIQGLYGVYLSPNEPTLSPRLADWPGSITAHQPASKLYLRYNYQPFTNALIMAYDTNHQNATIPLRLLLPFGFRPAHVHLDKVPLEWETIVVGEDTYLTATLPTGNHQLVVERSAR